MVEEPVYNPLDKINLGRSVVETLLSRPEVPLGQSDPFVGAGIYAIYYRGAFAPYEKLSWMNRITGELPIYVGKAVPKGARKGVASLPTTKTMALSDRIREHAASIQAASNLDLPDFTCRRLVVDDIWIPLGESLVIDRFRPLWNVVIDGFGNHDPGGPRLSGRRPRWDEVHPGRIWAAKCQNPRESREELMGWIAAHLEALDT